jgi:enhancing lycopene biosynthesis protein 2
LGLRAIADRDIEPVTVERGGSVGFPSDRGVDAVIAIRGGFKSERRVVTIEDAYLISAGIRSGAERGVNSAYSTRIGVGPAGNIGNSVSRGRACAVRGVCRTAARWCCRRTRTAPVPAMCRAAAPSPALSPLTKLKTIVCVS